MLDKLRRPGRSYRDGKLKKIFSVVVFGLICIVFVFIAPMGINLMGEGVVGQVGSEFIRVRDLRVLEENLRNQYKSRLEQADEETYSKLQQQIRSIALQNLVSIYVINYALQKEGLFLTDKELISTIQNIPYFQEEGRFLNSRYMAFLKSQNLSSSRFEERVRREKLADNWQKTFNQAVSSNELEKEKSQARHQYKVNLRYVTLKAEEIAEEKLEPFVQEKNKKEIEKFLKKAQVKWEQTGLFSLLLPLRVSIAHNETIMTAVLNQLPSKGLIPKLIRDDNKVHVVEVLSFSKEKNISPEDKQLADLISQNFEKSSRLFNSWMSTQRKHIKVEINPDQI
ncbi:MAG: SurA N-terminal domain-containing protein [Oligoflexia bacterium]|nr:SurA N-terminal domain-containing protein [Oligoflexia bacterium]